jgi:hypothetical protein
VPLRNKKSEELFGKVIAVIILFGVVLWLIEKIFY